MHFTFASAEALSAPFSPSSPAELVVVRRRRRRRRPGVKRELLVLWSLSGFIGEPTRSWAGVNESMENLLELISSWISSEYRTKLKSGLRNRYVYRLPRFVEPSIGLSASETLDEWKLFSNQLTRGIPSA